jgi:hypothetical protein
MGMCMLLGGGGVGGSIEEEELISWSSCQLGWVSVESLPFGLGGVVGCVVEGPGLELSCY